MSLFKTFIFTLKDYVVTWVSPVSSFLNNLIGGAHHKITELPDKKNEAGNNYLKVGRNIYLSDLDDTFIDWDFKNTTRAHKIKHRLVNRPTSEKIKLFQGAEEFVKRLNDKGVHTALISNKQHHKLISQAKHHSWGGVFDRLFGHDRLHALTMAKLPKRRLPRVMKYSRTAYPRYIIETLLDEKLEKGMEPVKVVFVGDKLTQDMLTAKLLDDALKKLNPDSSCISVLFNSRGYENKKINSLLAQRSPDNIVHNYEELEQVVNKYWDIEQEKTEKDTWFYEENKAEKGDKKWVEVVKKPTESLNIAR